MKWLAREPTEEMIHAARRAFNGDYGNTAVAFWRAVLRSAWDAAPSPPVAEDVVERLRAIIYHEPSFTIHGVVNAKDIVAGNIARAIVSALPRQPEREAFGKPGEPLLGEDRERLLHGLRTNRTFSYPEIMAKAADEIEALCAARERAEAERDLAAAERDTSRAASRLAFCNKDEATRKLAMADRTIAALRKALAERDAARPRKCEYEEPADEERGV